MRPQYMIALALHISAHYILLLPNGVRQTIGGRRQQDYITGACCDAGASTHPRIGLVLPLSRFYDMRRQDGMITQAGARDHRDLARYMPRGPHEATAEPRRAG